MICNWRQVAARLPRRAPQYYCPNTVLSAAIEPPANTTEHHLAMVAKDSSEEAYERITNILADSAEIAWWIKTKGINADIVD